MLRTPPYKFPPVMRIPMPNPGAVSPVRPSLPSVHLEGPLNELGRAVARLNDDIERAYNEVYTLLGE